MLAIIKVASFALAVACHVITIEPECAPKCWDNSRYVSNCENDINCLCEDSNFQHIVLQCLYSQCKTSEFGSALHHTISACTHVVDHDGSNMMPALIRKQGLRKRGAADKSSTGVYTSAPAYHSAAGAGNRRYVTHSAVGAGVRRFVTNSAPGITKATRSVHHSAANTHHPTLPTPYDTVEDKDY